MSAQTAAALAVAFALCGTNAQAACNSGGVVVSGEFGTYTVPIPCVDPPPTVAMPNDPWAGMNPTGYASPNLPGLPSAGPGAQPPTAPPPIPSSSSAGSGGGGSVGGQGRSGGVPPYQPTTPYTPPDPYQDDAGRALDAARQPVPAANPASDAAVQAQQRAAAQAVAILQIVAAFRQFESGKLTSDNQSVWRTYAKQLDVEKDALQKLQTLAQKQSQMLSANKATLDAKLNDYARRSPSVLSDIRATRASLKNHFSDARPSTSVGKAANAAGRSALSKADRASRVGLQSAMGAYVAIAEVMAGIADGTLSNDPHAAQVFGAVTGLSAADGARLTVTQAAAADLAISCSEPLSSTKLDRIVAKATAVPEPNRWRDAAFEKVGITPLTASSNTALAANRRITGAYAELYRSNPRLFQWAGIAALASSKVGIGLQDAFKASDLEEYPLMSEAAILVGAPAPERVVEALRLGNMKVFGDMYWQHMAYQQGGIEALRAAAVQGLIPSTLAGAWEKIEQARVAFAAGNIVAGDQLVAAATFTMARYEQEVVLQGDVFSKYAADFAWATKSALNIYRADTVGSPVPGGRPFDAVVPDGTIDGLEPRWRWFKDGIYTDWRNYQQSQPGDLDGRMKTFEDWLHGH